MYMDTYKPAYAIKLSSKNFGFEDNKKIVPLYAAFCIQFLVQELIGFNSFQCTNFEVYKMDYVYVTKENIEQEHICCAIRSNSDVQARSKKD